MREILFRGKPLGKLDEDFVYGSLGVIGKDLVAIYQCEEYYEDIKILVDISTVGQYTGLTDKNGKKIFEGDIILFEDESPTNYEYHDSTEMRVGEIKFDGGEFYLTNRIAVEMSDLVYDNKLDGQIVGNIHDNPELLNGE